MIFSVLPEDIDEIIIVSKCDDCALALSGLSSNDYYMYQNQCFGDWYTSYMYNGTDHEISGVIIKLLNGKLF